MARDPSADRSRPLRILLVSNLYPSPRHPAFGTFVEARVVALRAAGARVDVAAITDDRRQRGVGRSYLRLGLWSLLAALRSRLAGRPHDVVEAHIAYPTGLVAWPAARLAGARLVLFAHGSDVLRLPWRSTRQAWLARRLFAHADLVVANSRSTADVATRRLGPLRRPPLTASPGIDLPMATWIDEPRDPGGVLFVGRLVEGKGPRTLLAALDTLAATGVRADLTIVGDGPLRAELESLVAASTRLRDRVTFAGPLGPGEVAARYRAATVVAVPSIEPEGLGLVALEAMAAGALVVATEQGGLAEIVRDGENGRVVPAGDAIALGDAIRDAIAVADSPAGRRWRAEGRKTAEQHGRQAMVAATLASYRDLT